MLLRLINRVKIKEKKNHYIPRESVLSERNRATMNPNIKDQAVFASENINQQKNSYTRHQHGS
jgi:hypothetical protein